MNDRIIFNKCRYCGQALLRSRATVCSYQCSINLRAMVAKMPEETDKPLIRVSQVGPKRLKQLPDDVRKLVEEGAACSICLRPAVRKRLALDHSHDTGQIRGLLCLSCNGGLGMFRDRVDLLQAAIRYLQSPPANELPGTMPARLKRIAGMS